MSGKAKRPSDCRPRLGLRGLGKSYNHLIIAATTQDLIDRGLLSDFRVFAPSHPDLTGARTVAGDYHEGQLPEKMQEGTLTADIVATWMAKGEWQISTLHMRVIGCTQRSLQAQFRAAGVSCAYMDAFTEDEDVRSKETGEMRVGRKTIKKDFHSGRVKVVALLGTLTTGIDWDVRRIISSKAYQIRDAARADHGPGGLAHRTGQDRLSDPRS